MWLDTCQNLCGRTTRQLSTFCNFADKIIFYGTAFYTLQGISLTRFCCEAGSIFQCIRIYIILLLTCGDGILQLCYEHFIINMCNCLSNQFIAVELYGISIFVIDIIPECLELLLVEVVIQCVFLNLRFMAIGDHIIKSMLIKDALNQGVYTICDFLTAFRNRGKCFVGKVCTILVRYMIIFIDVIIFDQIPINVTSLLIRYCNINTADTECFADKIFCGCCRRAIVKILTNPFLQICHKVSITI